MGVETFFVSFMIAAQTFFSGALGLLSVEHQEYVHEHIGGVWAIAPGDVNWPHYKNAYMYMNEIGGHTLYVGQEHLDSKYDTINAEVLCHEAAHGAGHQHGTFLYQLQADCAQDVQRSNRKDTQ